ncbi:MAG: aldo/keto reductase [Deltaproteobacteria bacterium]|nr:aldo/keto reductase [Deltaproteobacteria bacterium]MBW2327123.1 aldo/keto reductase [Deltaproteobacteria bacterium]
MENQNWLITSAGVKMPRIIYGTAWKKDRTGDLVVKAIQTGFRGIDTACQPKHYNEALVGTALQRLKSHGIEREELFLQTKFTPLSGQDPRQMPYDMNAPVEFQVAQSFEASKKNLQTEYVDSLVLHSPMAPHALLMKAWNAMEKIQKTGGARQLGISNCYDPEVFRSLYADANVKPAVVQNRFYQETGYDTNLRHWCSNHGVIYQSFWTLTANPQILASNTVRSIAQKYKKTEAQIFFRYLSQSGIVPLTGTSSEQHMREDLSIFDFELFFEDLKNVGLLLN